MNRSEPRETQCSTFGRTGRSTWASSWGALLRTLALAVSLTGLAGCQERPGPKVGGLAEPDPESAPALRVHADNIELVYRYFPTGSRRPKTVTSIEDVPAGAREMVLVIGGESAPGLSYVANLTVENTDGTYPYRVVVTSELDRTLDESRGSPASATSMVGESRAGNARTGRNGNVAPTLAGSKPKQSARSSAQDVVMFSAAWCGVCGKAKRWFRNKGIAFTEKDIEKDPGARGEMHRLAKEANFPANRLSGVPVIWVKGRMFSGFDPRSIEAALKGG